MDKRYEKPRSELRDAAELLTAIRTNDIEKVNKILIVEKTLPIDGLFGDAQVTPLYFASAIGNLEIMWLLIKNGANIDKPTRFGFTPLMTAILNDKINSAKMLIENGADVNKKYPSGDFSTSIYQQAVEKGNKEIIDLMYPKISEETKRDIAIAASRREKVKDAQRAELRRRAAQAAREAEARDTPEVAAQRAELGRIAAQAAQDAEVRAALEVAARRARNRPVLKSLDPEDPDPTPDPQGGTRRRRRKTVKARKARKALKKKNTRRRR